MLDNRTRQTLIQDQLEPNDTRGADSHADGKMHDRSTIKFMAYWWTSDQARQKHHDKQPLDATWLMNDNEFNAKTDANACVAQ